MIRSGNGGPVACAGLRVVAKISGDWSIAKKYIYINIYIYIYSPLPERPRLSLRTINLIQSGMLVRKCISGEKSDIVLSNHN